MTDDARDRIPAHTTPTWEMELLVSGATIFGLLQLPELLDHGYFRAINLSPDAYAGLWMPLWLYTKIAVVTLLLTFLAHLSLRGYWVALVGMDSVFPGGIRWDRLGLGPVARERLSRSHGDIAAAIERADNRATRLFGVGFSLAMLMTMLILLVAVSIGASLVMDLVTGPGHTLDVLLIVMTLAVGPWVLATIIDRRFGHRLGTWPRVHSFVDTISAGYARIGLGARSNPLVALFASNVGRFRFAGTALVVILSLGTLVVLQSAYARGQLSIGLYGLAATDPFSPGASPAAFYTDQRGNAWSVLPLPTIPSRVVDGPYVELFVPFIPRLHGGAMRMACPRALAGGERIGANRAVLDCLARMIDIRLDGQPIPASLDASTDGVTGQPGLLAMLPTAGLAPGRHEITLNEPDRRALDGEESRRYRIPFWK